MSSVENFFLDTQTIEYKRADVYERILPIEVQFAAHQEDTAHNEMWSSLAETEKDQYNRMEVNELDQPYESASKKVFDVEWGLKKLEERELQLPPEFKLDTNILIGAFVLLKNVYDAASPDNFKCIRYYIGFQGTNITIGNKFKCYGKNYASLKKYS
jgi:hypothetical protein